MLANYAIFDIEKGSWFQPWGNETIQECSWTPDGDLIWAKEGNLFLGRWQWDGNSLASSDDSSSSEVQTDRLKFTEIIKLTNDKGLGNNKNYVILIT